MDDLESQSYALFTQAIARPRSEWSRFLDEACASPELRALVERLLDLHADSVDFLPGSAVAAYPSLVGPFGEYIAEFKLVREIGRGGMGVVYLAEDTILKRAVALKVITHRVDERDLAERVRREASASARLSHPGIVRVFRSGEEREFSYIAMEYIDGTTLRDEIESRKAARVPPDDAQVRAAARIVSTIAEAIDHAHQAGVVHRDVKPSNILLDRDGRALLTDFGIARVAAEKSLLADGGLAGSFAYMSPEQAKVNVAVVDHRTDVFSLGVVLYEAISLRRPFAGETVGEVFRSLAKGQPLPLRRVCPRVSADLATICHTAMAPAPNRRYQTAAHMAADLRCFFAGRPILARPPGPIRRCRDWIRTRQKTVLTAVIFAFALALVTLVAVYEHKRREAMGRLVVADTHSGAQVTIDRYSDDLRVAESWSVGTAPLSVYLRPGLYRVHVRDRDRVLSTSSIAEPGSVDIVAMNYPSPNTRQSLVSISAGEHELGKVGSEYPFSSPRRVYLPAYRISKTEVSNREYHEFVVATGARPPPIWPTTYDPKLDDLPVSGMTWTEANLYCRWRGVRLPTPDEWEAASRGPGGSTFPWGNDFHPDVSRKEAAVRGVAEYIRFAQPVQSSPELATPLKVMHMMSNVQEYTEGIAADRNNGLIVKGRSWANSPYLTPADLFTLPNSKLGAYDRGFRVATSD